MVFSSLIFLCVFFPLQMLIYYIAKKIETKNTVLILFSLAFYAWGEPSYIIILLFMTLCDWFLSQYIEKYRGTPKSRFFLIVALVIDIGLLAFFKYGTFCIENLHYLTGFPQTVMQIALPIGISFYTFQLISYLVDVYRGEVQAQKEFRKLLLYVCLFHQCIAGPIVRYKDISEQIISRRVTSDGIRTGINRFASGLAKKVLLANVCGNIANDTLFGGEVSAVNAAALENSAALALWIGVIAYTMQIYLDFSAYSDMAIGMGLMVGFKYKENFNYPYTAVSVTDFWRRWHISLSSFFRDYVYIPLGGNRKGTCRTVLNLLVVWALTGMWHGAGWNFILWGLYYFIFLALEKFVFEKVLRRVPKPVIWFFTLLIVMFGWVLFYFKDMSQISLVLKGMFCLNGNGFANFEAQSLLQNNLFFLVVAAAACTPFPRRLYHRICESRGNIFLGTATALEVVLPVLALIMSISFLVVDAYNPFLYTQF